MEFCESQEWFDIFDTCVNLAIVDGDVSIVVSSSEI